MDAKQLMWIKNVQREHQRLFGASLIIDFDGMTNKGRRRCFDEQIVCDWLKKYVSEKNIDLDFVKNNRLYKCYHKEFNFIKDYAAFIKQNNYDYGKAAKLIGKERTTLRYHIYGK